MTAGEDMNILGNGDSIAVVSSQLIQIHKGVMLRMRFILKQRCMQT